MIPLQYSPLANGYDQYGYLEEGIVQPFKNVDELKNLVSHSDSMRHKLSKGLNRFDATYGTNQDGRSAMLAAESLHSVAVQ